ncbi:nucleotidyltransferase domain-containing protein [Clostridium grantii]|nr:nucleotidyltransferase family protein [Clostridium grantii]
MNAAQIQLINFLSAAIHDERLDIDQVKKINFKSIIDEAEAHNIKGLVYSAINKNNISKYIDKEQLEQWKKETFFTAVYQIQHIKQISHVLEIFNKEKIPVIVLKGLVIRDIYPKPELRTMCDADILVHKEDLDKVKKQLLKLGYIEYGITKAHIVFEHIKYPPIEVHWFLTYEDFFKKNVLCENEIWKKTMKVKVGGTEALSLSFEDIAVHLCLHMAIHSASSGFGVRQLCDLVLLVEKKGDLIDWSSFVNKIREYGIDKFTMAIFTICRILFNMTVPEELNSIKLVKRELLNLLIDDIFESGVHGNRTLSKMFSNKMAYNSHDKVGNNSWGILKRFIMFVFPPINKLSDRYAYAKKYIILLPIAWIHHFFSGVFSKEYSFFSKIKFLVSTVHISKKRNKILKGLELI